jgi:DNA-binding helix-hairpin-helix protein with protein kinase domain
MSIPRLLRTQSGQQINLGRELGRGGEGIVYEVQSAAAIAAKIYHPDKAAERQQKVEAMVVAGWHNAVPTAAFPIDALFAGSNHFLGFTMPLISGQREIHDLYSPTSRRTSFPTATFRFLAHTSLNIARAIAGVHATGCVVGDLNQSGILIAKNSIATLIDCDSFQVTVGGRTFICKVGKEEFTPPELQGERFDQLVRTANHDAFGLAVIIFQLLFMGRHPFAGRFLGRGDMPMQTAIADYRFAYSARKSETKMEPPPHVPLLADLPTELSNAFEVAFGQIGSVSGRPTAADWVSMLGRAEQQIVSCQHNPAHHFFRAATSCPWCRMESAYPGFFAFIPTVVQVSSAPINLVQLIAAVRGASDPGIAPDLSNLMPTFSGTASPITANMRTLAFTYMGALIGVFAAVLMFRAQVIPAQFVIPLLVAAVFFTIRQPKQLETIEKAAAQAGSAWKNIESQWGKVKDNTGFLTQRNLASDIIRQFQALQGEESRRLAELKVRQQEAQLTAFLECFYIDHPGTKIKGVGNGRKVVLRSYGIETAADVVQHRIQQISGFGPKLTGDIVAWRKSLERRFVFNPNQPINPADIATVKAQIVGQQIELEKKLRTAHSDLQNSSQQTQSLRMHLRNAAIAAWNAKGQSDLDASTYLRPFSRRNRIIAVAAASLLALMVPSSFRPPELPKAPVVSLNRASKSMPTAAVPRALPNDQSRLNQAAPSPPLNIKPPEADSSITERIIQPQPDSEVGTWSLSPTRDVQSADSGSVAREPIHQQEPQQEAPYLPSPLNNEPVERDFPAKVELPPAPVLQSLNTRGITSIQGRLHALGYTTSVSGVWDTATRAALRDFKVTNHLDASTTWDIATQQSLEAVTALPVTRSFVGNWSTAECRLDPEQEAPLSINSYRAKSNAGGVCDFRQISNFGQGWRIQAVCHTSAERWASVITLKLDGAELIWSSGRGTARYFRCQ